MGTFALLRMYNGKMPTPEQYNPNDFHTFTPQSKQEKETISGLALFIICLVVVAVVVGVFFAAFFVIFA